MTATISEAPVGIELTNKSLISDQLWTRLVNRLIKDEDMERTLAERVMDQALGFLRLCAADPKGRYSPSPLVDTGWHTFIVYTRDYAEFCERVAGRFIHHAPFDMEGVNYGTGHVTKTVAAMKANGIQVDEPLWASLKANCEGTCGPPLKADCDGSRDANDAC